MKNKSYAGIDYFRLVSAFMVVAIHISPFACWNATINYLLVYCVGRVAVPFFFMVTGYFILAPCILSKSNKTFPVYNYCKKIIKLYCIATVIYLPENIYAKKLPHTLLSFVKTVFFDGTFYHLWFFPALIIGCVLLICLSKNAIRFLIPFSIIAYIIGLFGDSYYGLIKQTTDGDFIYNKIFSISSYTRNGIFYAPIFLCLGILISIPQLRCSIQLCKKGLVISTIFMCLEGLMTYHLDLQRHNSMYLFLIPVMYFLFQLLLSVKGSSQKWIRNCSMWIYIIHPAMIIFLRGVAKVTKLTDILVNNSFIQYVVICTLALFGAVTIQYFLERKKENVQKRKSMD